MKSVYYVILTILYFSTCSFAQLSRQIHLFGGEIKNIDSLERLAAQKKENTLSYLTLLLTLENSRLNAKPDKLGADLETIRQLAIELKNQDGLALYHYFLARKTIAFNQDYKEAYMHYTKALDGFKNTNDTAGLIKVHIQLSNINLNAFGKITGSMEHKLAHAREATKLAILLKNKELLVRSLRAEGSYYFSEHSPDLDKFESIQKRILKIIDSDSSLLSLKILVQMDLGVLYLETGLFQKAIDMFNPALKQELSIVSPHNRFLLYNNVGQSYISLGNYSKAYVYAIKATTLAKKYSNPEDTQAAYRLLERLNTKTGNYRQALYYANLNSAMTDSLSELNKSQQLNDLQVKYETEKKDQTNKMLEQKNEFIQHQNKQYLIGLTTALAGVIIVVILIIIVKKSNDRLKQTNKQLDHLTNAQKRFFSIIAHDLRTPIISFTGLFDVASHLLKTRQMDRLKTISERIDTASIKVDQLLNNLLQYAHLHDSNSAKNTQTNGLKPIIEDALSVYEVATIGRELVCSSECPEDISVVASSVDVNLIIRNLIDNAIKNSNSGGFLLVRAGAVSDSRVELEVYDTGKGIEPNLVKHLNEIFKRITPGYVGEQGLGLGMILISEAILRIKGSITVESEVGKYTKIKLILPCV